MNKLYLDIETIPAEEAKHHILKELHKEMAREKEEDGKKCEDFEVEGKNVAQAFADGRINEICEYCEKDVELTRKIYKRMVFEDLQNDVVTF